MPNREGVLGELQEKSAEGEAYFSQILRGSFEGTIILKRGKEYLISRKRGLDSVRKKRMSATRKETNGPGRSWEGDCLTLGEIEKARHVLAKADL